MGKYKVIILPKAKKELNEHHSSGNKAVIKRLEILLNELSIHPKSGTGKPEMLKYDLIGFWSRRINSKDRLIYTIEENIVTVYVVAAMGHYGDH